MDLVNLADLVEHGHDQGHGDMPVERKEGLCCSHIGSKNVSSF